jgi:hypothetical protein
MVSLLALSLWFEFAHHPELVEGSKGRTIREGIFIPLLKERVGRGFSFFFVGGVFLPRLIKQPRKDLS